MWVFCFGKKNVTNSHSFYIIRTVFIPSSICEMFGNFENNNHDTQEVINNLSMAELVTQTKNELANLKKNITQSKLFDNQEKH